MRLYIDFVSGEISAEWPFKKGGVLESVKALTGEEVEIRFTKDGVPVSLGSGVLPKLQVRETKGAGLLAELTSFTAPTEVSTGFYTGVLSFNTTAVQELLAAHPERASFAAVAAVFWTVSSLDRESDDLALNLLRRVGASGEDPLVLLTPWDWLKARLVAGSNVTLTANDEAETITINAEAGGGAWNDITGKPSTFPPSSHTHAIADTSGLQTALDGKAAASHTHAQSEVTGLVSALDGKAATSHAHAIADTTGLQTALDGKAAASHTHSQSDIGGLSSTIAGLESAIAGKAAASHAHAIGDLPAASQVEAEAGTNTTKVMTPQRVAQAIAAQAGGVTDFGVIYVAANGNDTTGDGSPGKPYATIQKAWDAGRSGETLVARLGVGNFGSLQITGAVSPNLTFIGQGNHLSIITDLSSLANLDMDGTLTIQGSGFDIPVLTTNLSSLTLHGPFRISFTAVCRSVEIGGAGGSVELFGGVSVASVEVSGVTGAAGDSETPGGNGGNGGSVLINGSRVDNDCNTSGAPPGGDGGAGSGSTGMGGSTQLTNFSVLGTAPTTATYVTASVVAGVFHASNTLP